eukprot:NODE_42_length_34079_cov_0.552619.p17 type:complete len:150 gc:universal NODE_42_length_34079_cov_0.552619:30892-31341(+)
MVLFDLLHGRPLSFLKDLPDDPVLPFKDLWDRIVQSTLSLDALSKVQERLDKMYLGNEGYYTFFNCLQKAMKDAENMSPYLILPNGLEILLRMQRDCEIYESFKKILTDNPSMAVPKLVPLLQQHLSSHLSIDQMPVKYKSSPDTRTKS